MNTANPYMRELPLPGNRNERIVDVDKFAQHLAHALNSEQVVAHLEPFAGDVMPKWRSKIRLSGTHDNGGGLDILISTDHASVRHNGRVSISFGVNDVPDRDIDPSYAMPSIGVNTERDIKVIAKDVIKRGILAAIDQANRVREHAKANHDRRGMLDDHVAQLENRFPGLLKIEKQADGMSATVRINPRGSTSDYFYLWGRIDHYGRFTLDRVQTMSPEFFSDFLALIQRHDGSPS